MSTTTEYPVIDCDQDSAEDLKHIFSVEPVICVRRRWDIERGGKDGGMRWSGTMDEVVAYCGRQEVYQAYSADDRWNDASFTYHIGRARAALDKFTGR